MEKKRPPLLGLRHIALRVKKIKESEAFYVECLGFKVEWRPDAANLYLTSGTDNLALHEASSKLSDGSGPLDHFGFLVKSPQNVDAWADYLQTSGVKLSQQPKTHRDGARSLYFRDPDGNLIQILYHPTIC